MNTNPLQQFRDTVHQALPKRADAAMDLLDVLTAAGHVESPVATSESVLFRREFPSVYDVLEEGELPKPIYGRFSANTNRLMGKQ